MKYVPDYKDHESDYDLDHQITEEVGKLNELIKNVNCHGNSSNREAIMKALAQTVIEEI